MLQLIREHTQGIVIWAIVGLIIVTFATFGLSSYLSGTATVSAASVNGEAISQTDFQRAYNNYQENLQRMLGDRYRPDFFPEERIKQEVIDGLVTQKLISQFLDDAGFVSSPQQVVKKLKDVEAFHEGGSFSSGRYKEVLSTQGLSSEYFEQQVSRDIVAEQLLNGIKQSAFVTKYETQQYLQLRGQQRDVGYMLLPKRQYLNQVEVSDDDIETYYQENLVNYTTPEQVSVDYLELDLNALADQFDISEDHVRQTYDENRGGYALRPEQRKARHILVNINKDTDEKAALAKLQDVRARIEAGEPFEKLAKEVSQDPGSANQGGDLGFFGRGIMDKAFEEEAFSLSTGEVSQPIRSRFGYHLIMLEAIKPAEFKSFEQVRAQIRRDLQIQNVEKNFYEDTDKLNNLAYENPDSLQPAAEELGLAIKQSTLFNRSGGVGLTKNPKVVTTAFSDEVLNQGHNSDLIEISDTHVVVLRRHEHKAAQQKSLDEVKDQIKSQLRDQAAREKLHSEANDILGRLNLGELPEDAAETYTGVKWVRSGFIGREAEKKEPGELTILVNPEVRRAVFKLPRPKEGQVSFDSLDLSNGDVAVVAVYGVRGSPQEASATELQQEQRRLTSIYSNGLYNNLLQSLRGEANISIRLPEAEEGL